MNDIKYQEQVHNHRNYLHNYIKRNLNGNNIILNIGTFSNIWDLVFYSDCFQEMDGVEAYKPYIEKIKLLEKQSEVQYTKLYNCRIQDFVPEREYYDIAIMFSLLEHLSTEDAQKVLKNISKYCKYIFIDIPYCKDNDANVFENEYQKHLQNDLTPDIMLKRYPELKPLLIDEYRGLYVLKKSQNIDD